MTISDAQAINLDQWATNPPSIAPGPFIVFDLAALPTGWTLKSPPSGYHYLGDPDPSHYFWGATITTDDGRDVILMAQSAAIGDATAPTGQPMTVHDQPAFADGDALT